MIWKPISKLIGSRWRTFCGLSKDDFLTNIIVVLDELGYKYETMEVTATEGEKRLLGAESSGVRVAVSHPIAFDITVIVATVDPMTNFMMSLFVTEGDIEKMTSNLCVVTIRNINTETRTLIAQFMSQVIDECDRSPWRLTHHLKFRLAVLLRMKVKLLWVYWIHVTNSKNKA